MLSYALFPQVALEYFKEREMNEKGVNLKDLAAIAVLYMRSTEKKPAKDICEREEADHGRRGPRANSEARGVADLKLKITANGHPHEVVVEKNGGEYKVTIDDAELQVALQGQRAIHQR